MNDPRLVKVWNDYERPHLELREFLERVDRAGELLRIPRAHWNLEMGTLAEIVYRQPNPPALPNTRHTQPRPVPGTCRPVYSA